MRFFTILLFLMGLGSLVVVGLFWTVLTLIDRAIHKEKK